MQFVVGTEAAGETLTATDEGSLVWGGGGGADTLTGGAGDDLIIATTGDHVNPGGGSNEIILLGAGSTIDIDPGPAVDVVFGFGAGDSFRFSAMLSPREISLEQDGFDAVLRVGGIGGLAEDAVAVHLKGEVLHDLALSFGDSDHLIVQHVPPAPGDLTAIG